jgi:hypothetical protein
MPRLNKFIIDSGKHSKNCPLDARRLYIRMGRKRQRLVPWGAVCLICNLVVYPSGRAAIHKEGELKRQEKRRWDRQINKQVKTRDKINDLKKQFQDEFNKNKRT